MQHEHYLKVALRLLILVLDERLNGLLLVDRVEAWLWRTNQHFGDCEVIQRFGGAQDLALIMEHQLSQLVAQIEGTQVDITVVHIVLLACLHLRQICLK